MWNESHTDPSNGDGAEDATAAAAATGERRRGRRWRRRRRRRRPDDRALRAPLQLRTLITLREPSRALMRRGWPSCRSSRLLSRRSSSAAAAPPRSSSSQGRPSGRCGTMATTPSPPNQARTRVRPTTGALVAAGVSQGPNAAASERDHGRLLDGAEAAAAAGALAALGPRTIPRRLRPHPCGCSSFRAQHAPQPPDRLLRWTDGLVLAATRRRRQQGTQGVGHLPAAERVGRCGA